ncbi:MAG TPA: triose-phosphate isomerase [Gemmatimonadaceae bacterium]
MRVPIFAANWKMNHGPTEARAFMRQFLSDGAPRDDRTVMMFPSALAFAAVREAAAARPDILLGVQNIATEAAGAFTGENSAPIARDAGASCVLVGHSERRHVFGETDEATALKCAVALAHGLTPVLCVGEKLEERERGETEGVVLRQLRTGISKVAAADLDRIVLAYEPVWAIGTGKNATPDDASSVHRVLRRAMERHGARSAIPILYGGSVKPANAGALLAADAVDGLLVGGASLAPDSWLGIVNSV